MAITGIDGIVNALGNSNSRQIIDKASLGNQLAGVFCSMWRATGTPAQAAIPTTSAVPTSATLGAMGFTNQTAPAKSYFGWMYANSSNANQIVEIHDRLAHMGGLSLNVNTAQTVTGLDLLTLAPGADRIGSADYSDVQWWLEVYTDGGGTASNATINVTFNDGSTGNLNTIAVGGTIRAGRMYSLDALRTGAQQNLYIRGVNSVTLSAATGSAGNFGFTVTRPRTVMPLVVANKTETFDWAALGLAVVPNDACLFVMTVGPNTSSGTLRGGGKIIHG
jgi:hypothetical protein